MKIRDIVETGYGDNDEVGPAATKASQRGVVTTQGNMNNVPMLNMPMRMMR